MAGTKRKRRPPWGATKKQAEEFSKERALKNRIHALEREVAGSVVDRQRLTEANVKLAEEIRVIREQRDAAEETAVSAQSSFRAAMEVTFSRGDLNQAKDDVLHVATSVVEAFARGLASGKTT